MKFIKQLMQRIMNHKDKLPSNDSKGTESRKQGYIFNSDKLPNGSQIENYLNEWLVNEGELVEEGDPIFIIRNGEHFASGEAYLSQPLTSNSSGILKHFKMKGETINNGDWIFEILEIGIFKEENLPANSTFYSYFNKYKYAIPKEYSKHNLEVQRVLVEDGQYVLLGEQVLEIRYVTAYHNSNVLYHCAEKSGYIDIVKDTASYKAQLSQRELLYIINDNDNKRMERKFRPKPIISYDPFTKKKSISWKASKYLPVPLLLKVGTYGHLGLSFLFQHTAGSDFIVFKSITSKLKLGIKDRVSFMFEDDSVLEFTFNTKPYKNEGCLENKLLITLDELDLFSKVPLSQWKVHISTSKLELLGDCGEPIVYESINDLQLSLQMLAMSYLELIPKEIHDYQPLLERVEVSSTMDLNIETCYVYLMVDTVNDCYKIGISNQPEFREKTLQSEKPTIELLAKKKFIRRKIAKSFEKALHETYTEKRIRGEWFQLDKSDVDELMFTLND